MTIILNPFIYNRISYIVKIFLEARDTVRNTKQYQKLKTVLDIRDSTRNNTWVFFLRKIIYFSKRKIKDGWYLLG